MKSSDEGSNLLGSDGLPVRLSGEWIRRKHHYLDRYCAITATGMKNRFSERVFLDVMSGPGLCRIKDSGEELSGSPLIAMKHDFTKFVFVESDGDLATALEKRIQNHPKAKLSTVIHHDWTREVAAGRLTFSEGLVVAFVDPTGIKQAPWEAMKQLLTSNPKIDILATLQYAMGITLNLYQYLESGSEQTTALAHFLVKGTGEVGLEKRRTLPSRHASLVVGLKSSARLGFKAAVKLRSRRMARLFIVLRCLAVIRRRTNFGERSPP